MLPSERMNEWILFGECWLFIQVSHSGRDGQQRIGYVGLELKTGPGLTSVFQEMKSQETYYSSRAFLSKGITLMFQPQSLILKLQSPTQPTLSK